MTAGESSEAPAAAGGRSEPPVPSATYRVQLHAGFTYEDAQNLLPYLRALGIGWVYTSPLFEPRPGSTHAYDVVDHAHTNPEPGDGEAFERFAKSLLEQGMAILLDVVPNHMCVAGGHNTWWNDVLENGPSSPFARYFDIDWAPPKTELAAKVLLPVLADQYGRILEEQRISVFERSGALVVRVDGLELPLAPRSWIHVLRPALELLSHELGEDEPDVQMLESILTAISFLPARTETDRERARMRAREKEVTKRRLGELLESSANVRAAIEHSLARVNGVRGDPRSFDTLEAMLADQAYRLSFWRVAADEINYRRFFDINDLAAIRVEEPPVFKAVHELPLDLVRRRVVRGLRIDHIDGLLDPEGYLSDLQRHGRAALTGEPRPPIARASQLPPNPGAPPLWVVVEKILERGERIDPNWACSGTTGYDILNALGGLLVDRRGVAVIRRRYRRRVRRLGPFRDVAYAAKRLVLDTALASELTVIARRLDRISEQHRHSRDFTLPSLRDALAEVIATFPVYRTYARRNRWTLSEADRAHVRRAVADARNRNPTMDRSVFQFVEEVLLLEHPEGLSPAQREERRDFVLRLQQLTSPVMAKGIEDTAFYRHYPLACLNEVGGDPERGGTSLEEFHSICAARAVEAPHALTSTSTHDTKRSEDVRARIAVLSEIPEAFEAALRSFVRHNRAFKVDVSSGLAPDANDEYLFYQTVFGTLPIGGVGTEPGYIERIQNYMDKALKEAKVHTSWISPNAAYDDAVRSFVARALTPSADNRFVAELEAFVAANLGPGLWGAVTQAFLKCVVPGVPDVYQGTELFDFSLVDPDNRRVIDFAHRRRVIDELVRRHESDPLGLVRELAEHPEDGRVKMYVLWRALSARRMRPDVFSHGAYAPALVGGPKRRNLVAFFRGEEDRRILCLAGRHFARLSPGSGAKPEGAQGFPAPVGPNAWGETHVLIGEAVPHVYRERMTGIEVRAVPAERAFHLKVADAFRHLPVALLEPVLDETQGGKGART